MRGALLFVLRNLPLERWAFYMPIQVDLSVHPPTKQPLSIPHVKLFTVPQTSCSFPFHSISPSLLPSTWITLSMSAAGSSSKFYFAIWSLLVFFLLKLSLLLTILLLPFIPFFAFFN